MPTSEDPMGAVLQDVAAFNNADSTAMAAACADPIQILEECRLMSGRGRQPPKTGGASPFGRASISGPSGYRIALGEPRHVDVNGDNAYVVAPATMTFDLRGKQVTQTGSSHTVALRKVGADWPLTAWAWERAINKW